MKIERPDGVIIDGGYVYVPHMLNDGTLCPIGLRGDQPFVWQPDGNILKIDLLSDDQKAALKLT